MDDGGFVNVQPRADGRGIRVLDVVDEALGMGLKAPMVIRFQDLLRHRVIQLNECFAKAIKERTLTNLYNLTQPLIRYEVTDQVTLIDGTCPCGSSLRRIEDPQGRLDDTFVYANGLSVHPHLFRSALGQHRAIIEYQVRQTPRGATIGIVVAAETVDAQALHEKITFALSALGLADPQVAIEILAALTRQASGKLKRFVPIPN